MRFYNPLNPIIHWILLSIGSYYRLDLILYQIVLSVGFYYPLEPIIHWILISIVYFIRWILYPLDPIVHWILLSLRL
jgi:hypothetical protein